MQSDISDQSLPLFEALASGVRLHMLRLLAKKPMNMSELAQALGLSSAIMTMHVKKLESGGLIRTESIPSRGGTQRICSLTVNRIEVLLPNMERESRSFHRHLIPIGHYTDFDVQPTCGLATLLRLIGTYDEPRYFLSPERFDAKILWFGKGFVEYKTPNFLLKTQQPEELEITMEISSEAPDYKDNWPSDISFFFNGVYLGTWTSPGDFGGIHGKYTPNWWPNNLNQFGLYKAITVGKSGTFLDGNPFSPITLDQLDIRRSKWSFRVAVADDAEHIGGATLFGTGFGNYNQDIEMRLYYSEEKRAGKSEETDEHSSD